jgi:hypothetical protein
MHYLVSSVYKISMTSPDNGITNFGGILPPSARVKPVFHLRIFSREANFSFVFIQLVPDGSSWETNDKWKIRFARKNSQVENRHKEAKNFKNLMFCNTCWNYHKLVQTQFLNNPVPPRQPDVGVDKSVTCS